MNTKKWGCLILWFILLSLVTAFLLLRVENSAASSSEPNACFGTTSSTHETLTPKQPVKQETVPPILQKIAFCESGDRQFYPDGKLVIGHVDHADTGRFQINRRFHDKTAKAMGLDLTTDAGNTAYALFLYKTQGTRPWLASKGCWGTLEALKTIKKTYS